MCSYIYIYEDRPPQKRQLSLCGLFAGEKEAAQEPQPKKVGRPPKAKVKEEPEAEEEQPKRKVGRPKKVKVEPKTEVKVEHQGEVAGQVKLEEQVKPEAEVASQLEEQVKLEAEEGSQLEE